MRTALKITFFSALCLLFLAACKKDKNVLGVDVQPPDDALNASFSSTSPVYAYTMKYDSIASLNDRYKYMGINKDPYFGVTDAGLYLVPNIPDGRTAVFFGEDAHLTGSELILTIYNLGASYVGKGNAQVSYSVFPVATALDPAKVYYSGYDHFHNNQVVLGSYTGSFTTMQGKLVLRIPMNAGFASAVLNNPQYLVDNVGFQNTYKGFYIKSSLNGDDGFLAEYDVEDALSGFYLYYQNGTPSATKQDKQFRFTFGGTNPIRYTTMKQNFSTASMGLQKQINGDTTWGGDNIFLKGLGVSKARVYIPQLKSYSDSFNVSVNRAEVIFYLDPSFSIDTGYTPAPRLCLLPTDSIGRELYALDQVNATDAARYDGNYDADNKRYVFNIARHVQAILSGKRKNYGFTMVVANADNLLTYAPVYNGSTKELFLVRRDNYTERVVLAGSNKQGLKPVFNLSYVKLPHDK